MTCWLSFQSKDNTLDHNCVSNLVTRQDPSPLRHRVCNVETVPSFAAGTLQFRERGATMYSQWEYVVSGG